MATKLKKVRTAFGVDEYRLPNGLRVLYRYEPSAPVAAVCVTYHVGSRNEAKGHTGATHILEHLLFKDSAKFKKAEGNEIALRLEHVGAMVNATTWFDRTHYYELMPASELGLALDIEADRMRNALFTDGDLKSEMTVVRNEYERSRNNPFELLEEAVLETAFVKHPYRIPTIGSLEDIEASTAAKLREFYNVFYWPNNATLMVVGAVPWTTAGKLIEKFFGPIPASPHKIPQMRVREPAQKSARKIALKKPMGVSIASLYYKTPPATHKDFSALIVASVILGGGFASRLQKALVDTGLAADAGAFVLPLHDPGVAVFQAHVAPSTTAQKALAALRRVVTEFAKQGPTVAELERAKERLLAQFAQERDGVLGEARGVSEAIAAGDWQRYYRLEGEVKAMTLKTVARAAKKYFVPAAETSGILENKS